MVSPKTTGTLLIKVRLHDGDFGSAAEQDQLGKAEAAIESTLEGEPGVRLDGNEVGGGIWTMVIVGQDLDRARRIALSSLEFVGVKPTDVEFVQPPRPKRVLVGSIIAVPVDGAFAYIQYIGQDPRREMGDMVIAFDETTAEPRSLSHLRLDRRLFGPVFAAIRWQIAQGHWLVIGRRKPEDEPFPRFRYLAPSRPGRGTEWVVWDGETHTRVGDLSDANARLERRVTYLPDGLIGRISEDLGLRGADRPPSASSELSR